MLPAWMKRGGKAEEKDVEKAAAVDAPEAENNGQTEVAVPQDSDDTPEEKPAAANQGAVATFFKFDEHETNYRNEVLGGLTTFMAIAYILVVNPGILGEAIFKEAPQDLFAELLVATAVSSCIGTLIMGLAARYPFALAPGMGINAFFAFSVVIGLGIDWRLALGCVFVEGLIFIVLSLTGVRQAIIKAIPPGLRFATSAGIGMFIAYIGMSGVTETGGAGLIVDNPATLTSFGSLAAHETIMAIVGLVVSSFFLVRGIRGALLYGILFTSIIGWIAQISPPPRARIVELPVWPGNLFGQAVVGLGKLNGDNVGDFFAALFVFLFVDLFDTVGTLTGLGETVGYIKDGELPRANLAFLADAVGTTVGAVFGTSTVTTFVESAAGVSEGARTGLASIVTATLMLLCIFFIPVFEAIPGYATAPALVLVGAMMMRNLKFIDWEDYTEAIPAFLVVFMIPLTYSIAEGLSIGFIAYPLCKLFAFKPKDVTIPTYIIAVAFIARFIFMTLQFREG